MDAFFALRLAACDEAVKALPASGGDSLLPLVAFWKDRFVSLQRRFHGIDRNIVTAFRQLEHDGRLRPVRA